jgi:hypothetical protein
MGDDRRDQSSGRVHGDDLSLAPASKLLPVEAIRHE